MRRPSFMVFCAVLLIAQPSFANVCVYSPPKVRHICGVIVDAQGRGIPNVTVTVSKEKNVVAKEESDANGRFQTKLVSAGEYELRFVAPGFATNIYNVEVRHPAAACKRALRVEMAVGGKACSGTIAAMKASNLQR
jgi:Carboxypeptidase regulatory-like domain